MPLHLDLETRSTTDLFKEGLHLYVKNKYTDILCACFAFDDEPVQTWLPRQPIPSRVVSHIEGGGEVHAHNAAFEQLMINAVGKRYGWPYIYPDQLVCTMAQCYAMGLPGSLKNAAAALGLAQQKDVEGARLMMQMCKPRSFEVNTDRPIWWDSHEMRTRLVEYCKQDVVVEREVGKRTFKLSAFEKSVWTLDQEINNRGVCIDKVSVANAIDLIEQEAFEAQKRIQKISNSEIHSFTSVLQIKNYLKEYGIFPEVLDKHEVSALLAKDLPPDVREILEIRQLMGRSSTKKLEPMLFGIDSDSRLKGGFQYSGANTRRWSGRRVQLHNLKRPVMSVDDIDNYFQYLSAAITEKLKAEHELFYGSPSEMISNCMRGFIVAAPGYELVTCDFASIEARVLAWLAGQQSALDIFEKGDDIYVHEAARIFGVSQAHVTKDQRQVGKVACLALGYGGGVGALQQMCKGYGLSLAPIYKQLSRGQIGDVFKNYLKFGKGLSKEEFGASEIVKRLWRQSNSSIVQYWKDVEEAAKKAIQEPRTFVVGPLGREVRFKRSGSFLFCQLPSKGVICYPYPELNADGQLTYMYEDSQTKKWLRFKHFGGSLVQNITQSLARDLLAEAMLTLKVLEKNIVLHVHDEIVIESKKDEAGADLECVKSAMKKAPTWAQDLPIEVTGWRGARYRK